MLADHLGRLAGLLHFIFTATMTKPGMCSKAACAFKWGMMSWRRMPVLPCSRRMVRRTLTGTPDPGLVRYLLVMTSNTYSLIQDIHAMKNRSPAGMRAVFEKHDSELLGG